MMMMAILAFNELMLLLEKMFDDYPSHTRAKLLPEAKFGDDS